MILGLKEYFTQKLFQQLDEKLIMYNQGKRYGQIVFLAGGAGSGKGFAISNFMEGDKFKIRDVDEWKKAFQKIDELKKKYSEIRGLDLRKPKDVFKLHMFVKKAGIKENTLKVMLDDLVRSGAASKGTLPNIIFDITLKDISDITSVLPQLRSAGYKAENIHITWVLTDYHTAVKNNANRSRVVPGDILLKTHEGASSTMSDIIKGKMPRGVNGAVNVILNNRENTIPWTDKDGKPIKTSAGNIVVKDFTYINLKKEGKRFRREASVQQQIYQWIKDNVPETALKAIDEPKE